MRLGQFEKAEKNYQRALQLRPDYERAQLNYAALLFQMQEKQQARKLLEKVLKKNPLNLEARQALQMI
jgi:cytochrome c-type biogenesis protein CcmH/NrfG